MKRKMLFPALLALILPFLLSIACGSSGPPSIGDVVTAKSLDDSYKPVDATTTYQPQDTFFVSVHVQDLVEGSVVKVQYKLEGEVYEESTLTADKAGSGYYGFSLKPPELGHASGVYDLEVYLDDVLAKTVTFTVAGDATPSLSDAVLSKGLDDKNHPVDPTTTFNKTDVIYLSVVGNNLTAGMEIKVVYTYIDGQATENTTTITNPGTSYYPFSLSPSVGGHPAGDYTVDIYLNGKPSGQTLTFTVTE
jgi:hypothetical protein